MSNSVKRKGKSPSGVNEIEQLTSMSISDEQKPKLHSRNTIKHRGIKTELPGPDEGRTKKKTRGDELREKYYRTLGHPQYQEAYERGAEWLPIKKVLLKMNQGGGRKTLRKKRKQTTRKKKN